MNILGAGGYIDVVSETSDLLVPHYDSMTWQDTSDQNRPHTKLKHKSKSKGGM